MTRPRQRADADPLTPILEIVALTRVLATPKSDNDAWITAEAGQREGGTGTFKHGRRTASAGQYAAHAIRLDVLDADASTRAEPWNAALLKETRAIESWDWDTRMQGALNLRATYLRLEGPEPASVIPVKLVGSWLTQTSGDPFVYATARLAQYVLDHEELHAYLRPAWYATHGRRLLTTLAPPRDPDFEGGRPTPERRDALARLKAALPDIVAAHTMPLTEIADVAQITRPTIYKYLKDT